MSEKDREMYESELQWILNRNSEIATARENGLAAGIPTDVIAKCTGLTLEQIGSPENQWG